MRDQRGVLNALLIPFILVILLFVGAAAFGFWAFGSRQDYKNNSDQKVAAAVSTAKQQTQVADQATYAQQAKYPLRPYVGPSAYGSVTINYPKTWSAYVVEASSGGEQPIDGYFQPSFVPAINATNSAFALRVQLSQTSYSDTMNQVSSTVQSNGAAVAPYSLPKVPSVIGSKVTGKIDSQHQGIMVILPLRNMTLKVWTEQTSEEADFTNIILPNLTFSP